MYIFGLDGDVGGSFSFYNQNDNLFKGLCSVTEYTIIKIKFSEFSVDSSINFCVASGIDIK